MARESGLSKSTVHKLWASNDLKPHLSRTFKASAGGRIATWNLVAAIVALVASLMACFNALNPLTRCFKCAVGRVFSPRALAKVRGKEAHGSREVSA
jgi:hypothetical protein